MLETSRIWWVALGVVAASCAVQEPQVTNLHGRDAPPAAAAPAPPAPTENRSPRRRARCLRRPKRTCCAPGGGARVEGRRGEPGDVTPGPRREGSCARHPARVARERVRAMGLELLQPGREVTEETEMKRLMFVGVALASLQLGPAIQACRQDGPVTYRTSRPPARRKTVNNPKSVSDGPSGAKSYVAPGQGNREEGGGQKKAARRSTRPRRRGGGAALPQASRRTSILDGGRIFKNNEKGEREFMSDAEIDSERERTRREMEAACQGR